MKCPKCGNKLTKADLFCPDCGKKVPKLEKELKVKVKKLGKLAKSVKCLECGTDSESIPKKLKCNKCGTGYIRKHGFYFLKYIKCKKCHGTSKTITTKGVCDKCGSEYVYDPGDWYRDRGYYLKSRIYVFDRFVTSKFMKNVWVLIIALFFALTLIFSGGGRAAIYSIIPLIVVAYMGYKIIRRMIDAKFKFEKIIGVSPGRDT